MDEFLAKGKFTLRKENDITAEYYKDKADTYIVHCQIRERDELIAELNISVTSEQQAITLCDNWTKKNEEVYQFLVDNLFFKNWKRSDIWRILHAILTFRKTPKNILENFKKGVDKTATDMYNRFCCWGKQQKQNIKCAFSSAG